MSRVVALWLTAVGLAALAARTLYDAAAGLSWGLWTVGAVAAGVAFGQGRRVARPERARRPRVPPGA